MAQLTCPVCSKIFYCPPARIRTAKGNPITCSRFCAARYFRNKGQWVVCPVCSKSFWQTASKRALGYGNYCSHTCWGSTRKTPFGSKSNLFTHEQRQEWKDNECARCQSKENLELDHILAQSLGGKTCRENIQTLCKTCNLRKFQCEDLPAYLKSSR
jgi:HNH endonuclease